MGLAFDNLLVERGSREPSERCEEKDPQKRQRKSIGNLWKGGRKKIKTRTKRGQRDLWSGKD